jgi:hypothetical protein
VLTAASERLLATAYFAEFLFLRGSVNKGKKRKDRGPVWQEEGFVLDKDTGPPFGQDESLLL